MTRRLRHWSQSNPLARLALVAVAGIWLSEMLGLEQHAGGVALLAALSLIGACFLPRRVPVELPALLVFMLIHSVRLSETQAHPLRLLLNKEGPQDAVVIARLSHLESEEFDNPRPVREATLEGEAVTLGHLRQHLDTRVTIRGWVRAPRAGLMAGRYELIGSLRLPEPPTNPGQFDATIYSAREGFACDMEVRSLRLIEADALPVRAWLARGAERCREWIGGQLARGIEGEDRMLTIIHAMALGASSESSSEVERPFKETGTLHIFAVSGLHVVLVSWIGWLFLRPLCLPRSLAVCLLIAGVFGYAFITGWAPSAARAAIMVAILLAASWFSRLSQLQNSLGASAILLLAFDSQRAFLPGFQLSFLVLWAIAIFSPLLLKRLKPHTELDVFLPPSLADESQKREVWCKQWAAKTICVSCAAWLGSLPLMLWHFKTVTPIALVANCLLVPLSTCLLATSFISIVASMLHLAGGQMLFNSANWAWAKMMMFSAASFAAVPGGHFSLNPAHITSHAPFELSVLHLPFGEASSHLRVADRHWLIDTASVRGYSRIVQPALQFSSVSHLDGLFLSHSDVEHVGGAALALEDLLHPTVFLGGHEPWRYESSATSLRRLLNDKLLVSEKMFSGAVLDLGDAGTPPASVLVLYPSPTDLHDKADNRTLILRLNLGGFRLLMMSDAGFTVERALMDRLTPDVLAADVLVRNNHATDLSGTEEFLDSVRPRIVISSNAKSLGERMPATVSSYCRRTGTTLFDQGQTGAVTIEINGTRLDARTFVSKQHVSLLPNP